MQGQEVLHLEAFSGLKSAVVYMSASSGRQVEESMSCDSAVMRLTMASLILIPVMSVEAADTDGEFIT